MIYFKLSILYPVLLVQKKFKRSSKEVQKKFKRSSKEVQKKDYYEYNKDSFLIL
ncbi:MAG: hypothetical protein ACJATU_000253 [Rickettsiales bacterium]|jgi:hypothetical protein